MRTIEFKGITVEYDETVSKSWKWQKAVASKDEAKTVAAIERLFLGKDEEIADQLGDDINVMGELLAAITQDMATAKN